MEKKLLDETSNYVLKSSYENVVFLNKMSGLEVFAGDHYGDPECGLISKTDEWCITAGEGVILCTAKGELWGGFRLPGRDGTGGINMGVIAVSKEDDVWTKNVMSKGRPIFATSLKLTENNFVDIQLDPMSSYASLWRLDVKKKRVQKLRDGMVCR